MRIRRNRHLFVALRLTGSFCRLPAVITALTCGAANLVLAQNSDKLPSSFALVQAADDAPATRPASLQRFARSGLGDSARFLVPNRLCVSPNENATEFAFVKFLLVETGDKSVAGLEQGLVEMGGFVSFSIKPLWDAEALAAAAGRATILWKGLAMELPGAEDRPRFLSGNGAIGSEWNLNLLLNPGELDPLWQSAVKAANSRSENVRNGEASRSDAARSNNGRQDAANAGHSRPRGILMPDMSCWLVYRDHVELPQAERREYRIRRSAVREVFSRFSGSHSYLRLTDSKEESVDICESFIHELILVRGIDGIAPDQVQDVSPNLKRALFDHLREGLLVYDLVKPANAGASLILRQRPILEKQSEFLTFRGSQWIPVEVHFRIPVEAGIGSSSLRTINSHGFHRETRLTLGVIPIGDWDGTAVERVNVQYEVASADRVLDSGSMRVPIRPGETHSVVVTSRDHENVIVRTRISGYWVSGRYMPLRDTAWSETQATLRNHFTFLLKEDVYPAPPGIE